MNKHGLDASVRIGQTLKKLRVEAGIDQQTMSELTKIPRSNISQIESGIHSTSIDMISRIAKVLGVRIEIVKS